MSEKTESKKKKQRVADHPAVKCEKCGFHIRGKNHEDGTHHQIGKGGAAEIG